LLTGKAPADMPQLDLKPNFDPFLNTTPELREWLHYLCEPALEKRCQSARQAHTILLDLTSGALNNPTLMALGSPPGEHIRQLAGGLHIKWVISPAPEQARYSQLKRWHQQLSMGTLALTSPLLLFVSLQFALQTVNSLGIIHPLGWLQIVVLTLLFGILNTLFIVIPAVILRMGLDKLYQPQHLAESTLTLTPTQLNIHRNQDNYSDRIIETLTANEIKSEAARKLERRQYNHQIVLAQITAVYYRPLRTWKVLYHTPFYEFIFLQDDGTYARSIMAMNANEARWLHLVLLATISQNRPPESGQALRERSENYQQRFLPPGGE
jgi:hypothetical protein